MNEIKEMKKPVMAYEVCAKCPKCGGELIEGDNILLTEPLQYQYTCSKCGELFYATKSYPFIEFKSMDDVYRISSQDSSRTAPRHSRSWNLEHLELLELFELLNPLLSYPLSVSAGVRFPHR